MPPTAKIYDRIDITPEFLQKIKISSSIVEDVKEKEKKPRKKSEKTKSDDMQTVEDTMATHVSPQEDGTAMIVEQEVEEGVPQKQIDEDIKKSITKKPKKTKKAAEEGK